jgi:dipeptidyl aminopeptidase/acylaminoacyl peptidase
MIPRDILFGNPERTDPALSPDGKRLAWLQSDTNNVLQVWVQTVGSDDAKTVTADKKRGIRLFLWAEDNRTLLYLQDSDGDENFHVYGVDLQSGNVRDFTPFQGVAVRWVDVKPDFPDEAVVFLNARDRSLFDVYRLNLKNGALELDTENPGDVEFWHTDPKFRVRAAVVLTPDGGTEIRVRDHDKAPWKSFLKVGPDEILEAIGFTPAGQSLFLKSSIGRDTAAVVEKNTATGAEKIIASSDEVDAGDVIVNPRTHELEAVSFAPGRATWRVIGPGVKADFEGIAKLDDGDFVLANRTAADDIWLVGFHSDRLPWRFYRWDRKAKQGEFIFSTRPKLDGLPLSEMKSIVITARDGLALHCYLTLPTGAPARKLPMVLFPHGGPFWRDTWGYHPVVQWLADRGYAVLQPNFRGSTGYGKKHLNAGNREWGFKMHDDLIDCVNWAVEEGIADPKRIGIYGGSYGGYCSLAGLAFTPKVFACGVDLVGPSSLKTFLASIPPYWKVLRGMFDLRVGNPDDPKDADLLQKASPLNSADRIVRPLLIGHGANDPRVKQAESEQIVAAIEKNGGSVTYVLYPDEGHVFARPENTIDFTARAEQFLAEHLGGHFEPMPADKIPGSTAVVRVVKGKY